MALNKKLLIKDNPHAEALRNRYGIDKKDSWETMKLKISGEYVEPVEALIPPPTPTPSVPLDSDDDDDDDFDGELF